MNLWEKLIIANKENEELKKQIEKMKCCENGKQEFEKMTDIEKINELVQKEMAEMCEKHNQEKFNSFHEAYAVTKEEVEEVDAEMDGVKADMKVLWNFIKYDNTKSAVELVNFTQKRCNRAIQELIQVSACCEKIKRGFQNEV
ncbi:hypothetical protein [Treponema sp.]|uniref:hypothetical protein n=1 Tax=Treponema sp. TaxID=166 RepID=UPI003FD73A2B